MQEKKVNKERRMIGFKIEIDDNKSTGESSAGDKD
jgi:hypothetical protein